LSPTRGFRRAMSGAVGWAADRHLPKVVRSSVYRAYARFTGADLEEVRLGLSSFPSLGAFFVRELKSGARPIPTAHDVLCSPVDGTVQSLCPIERGTVVQAKGRDYTIADLLGSPAEAPAFEGGLSWTIYLSPRDYHRIHAPEACDLVSATWMQGDRFSVAPKVLSRRRVLDINERCAMKLECAHATLGLVLVGALNVGRIRVVGVEPGHAGAVVPKLRFERGAELARFEMGSTIVLLAPRGTVAMEPGLREGDHVRMGQPIGRWTA
jgi:phosphatidylserine decarboxylase